VLLQNYQVEPIFFLCKTCIQIFDKQQLNGTGFRKILKKHDKLVLNDRGMDWRINRVEKSSFFLNSDIESLINNVESTVINELEDGNRQAGMKRLKVPPLSEKQNAGTTFSLGMFMGIFFVLAIAIVLSWFGLERPTDEPKWVAVRLFRGFFLLFLSMWLCGLNMFVSHSLTTINSINVQVRLGCRRCQPRAHFRSGPAQSPDLPNGLPLPPLQSSHSSSSQSLQVMQISSFMLMLWAMAVLGYLYAYWLHLPPFLFPMLLMLVCVLYLLSPYFNFFPTVAIFPIF